MAQGFLQRQLQHAYSGHTLYSQLSRHKFRPFTLTGESVSFNRGCPQQRTHIPHAKRANSSISSRSGRGAKGGSQDAGDAFRLIQRKLTDSDDADGPRKSSTSSTSNRSSPSAGIPDNLDAEESEEVQVATLTVEKLLGAAVAFGIAMLLSNLAGVDATQMLTWDGGAPVLAAVPYALPVIVGISLLFLPTIDPGFTTQELFTISKLDLENRDVAPPATMRPPLSSESLKLGLWFYQMYILKPWFPTFGWSSISYLYGATCVAAFAQELLIRGFGGGVLVHWYSGLLAGSTDVNNPIYWAKVFKLVTPDTARWMAAATIFTLQAALSLATAVRAQNFTRLALNRVGRVAVPGADFPAQFLIKNDDVKDADQKFEASLEISTAEESVVLWTSLGVSILLCAASNGAWAASGSLVASYSAQLMIDGVVTYVQERKATALPNEEQWEEVRRLMEEFQNEEEEEEEEEGEDPAASGQALTKGATEGGEGTAPGKGSGQP